MKLLISLCLILLSCGSDSGKKKEVTLKAPSLAMTQGKKFQESYQKWHQGEKNAYLNYSYFWLDKQNNETILVDVTNRKISCRAMIRDNQLVWRETGSGINNHREGYKAITLDQIYESCKHIYDEDPKQARYYWKRNLVVGCSRLVSIDNYQPENRPFYEFSFVQTFCESYE